MLLRMKRLELTSIQNPKTGHHCYICGKDIKPSAQYRTMHVIGGGSYVLHPDDEGKYVSDGGDMGCQPIGISCAKKLGSEWSSR